MLQVEPEQETTTDSVDASEGNDSELVEQELLVEEVSIDGMCGVY